MPFKCHQNVVWPPAPEFSVLPGPQVSSGPEPASVYRAVRRIRSGKQPQRPQLWPSWCNDRSERGFHPCWKLLSNLALPGRSAAAAGIHECHPALVSLFWSQEIWRVCRISWTESCHWSGSFRQEKQINECEAWLKTIGSEARRWDWSFKSPCPWSDEIWSRDKSFCLIPTSRPTLSLFRELDHSGRLMKLPCFIRLLDPRVVSTHNLASLSADCSFKWFDSWWSMSQVVAKVSLLRRSEWFLCWVCFADERKICFIAWG